MATQLINFLIISIDLAWSQPDIIDDDNLITTKEEACAYNLADLSARSSVIVTAVSSSNKNEPEPVLQPQACSDPTVKHPVNITERNLNASLSPSEQIRHEEIKPCFNFDASTFPIKHALSAPSVARSVPRKKKLQRFIKNINLDNI